MSRLTEYRKDLKRYEYKQDERGYCYIGEGQIVNKLGELEDLIDEMDSVRIVKRDGITSLHIDMILTSETLPVVKEIFKDRLK